MNIHAFSFHAYVDARNDFFIKLLTEFGLNVRETNYWFTAWDEILTVDEMYEVMQ